MRIKTVSMRLYRVIYQDMDFCIKVLLIAILGLFSVASSATRTWTGGGADNNWTNAANWGGTAPVAGDELIFTGSTRLNPYNDFPNATTFGSIQINAGSGDFVLSGNSLVLASGAFAVQYLGTSGTVTIQNAITLAVGNASINTAAGGTLVFNGNIGLGTLNLTITGNGNVNVNGSLSGSGRVIVNTSNTCITTFYGTNLNSGPVDIQGGTLRLANTSALGASSLVTVYTGASLDLNGQNYATALPLILNGSGIANGGALQNSSTTAAVYAGLISLGSSASIVAGGGSIDIANTGTITGMSANLTIGGAAGGFLRSNVGTGNGSGLTKQDAGTWLLFGISTYTGPTIISAGILQLNRELALAPTTDLTVNGTLDMRGYNLEVGSLSGSGTIDKLSGNGNYTLTVGRNNTNSTFSGIMKNSTGSLGLTKMGTAILTLSGLNTYSGPTLVSVGTLRVGVSNAIPATSECTVNGTLDLNGISTSLGSLAGTGTVTNSSGSGTITLTVGGLNTNTTFSGAIQNASQTVALTKTGTGTLTLSGANTFIGSATVSAGSLNVTGSIGAGGVLTVNSAARLSGSGAINRDVVIQSGAFLSPGNSGVGTLTTGNLGLGELANLEFELGTSSDQVIVNGNMDLNGFLQGTAVTGFGYGSYTLFQYSGTLNNYVLRLGTMPAGAFGYWIALSATDVKLMVDSLAIKSLTPLDGASNVANTGLFLQLEFNQSVTAESGNITLRKSSNDSLIQTTSIVGTGAQSVRDSLLFDFESSNNLSILDTGMAMTSTQSSVLAYSGTYSAEIITPEVWGWAEASVVSNFSTYDTVSAWVYTTQASCAQITDQTGVAWDWHVGSCQPLTPGEWTRVYALVSEFLLPSEVFLLGIQFDKPGTYYVDEMRISRASNKTFRIPILTDLEPNTAYYVNADPGIVKDVASNLWSGISGKTVWNFTTVNNAPQKMVISKDSIQEKQPVGSVVGVMQGMDPDLADRHVFSLVAGTGDTDNSSFAIVGKELRSNVIFDFDIKTTFSVRVRCVDANGLAVEGVFAIRIYNLNEAPTDLVLSNSTVPENAAIGRYIGKWTSTDPDDPLVAQTFVYAFASGAGSTDNAAFTLRNDSLFLNRVLDFESKSSYAIRVRTTDQGGLYFEKQFTIGVTDVNEPAWAADSASVRILDLQRRTLSSKFQDVSDTIIVPNGANVSIRLGFYDHEGDAITLNVLAKPTGALDSILSGDEILLQWDANKNGLHSIVIESEEERGLRDTISLYIRVEENQAPRFVNGIALASCEYCQLIKIYPIQIPVTNLPEGFTAKLRVQFEDPESDAIQVRLVDPPDEIRWYAEGGLLVVEQNSVLEEDLELEIKVEDNRGAVNLVTLTIHFDPKLATSLDYRKQRFTSKRYLPDWFDLMGRKK